MHFGVGTPVPFSSDAWLRTQYSTKMADRSHILHLDKEYKIIRQLGNNLT